MGAGLYYTPEGVLLESVLPVNQVRAKYKSVKNLL